MGVIHLLTMVPSPYEVHGLDVVLRQQRTEKGRIGVPLDVAIDPAGARHLPEPSEAQPEMAQSIVIGWLQPVHPEPEIVRHLITTPVAATAERCQYLIPINGRFALGG